MIHDAFISHASEDKEEFVRPLADALVKEGVDIWYDEFSLKLGDSLSESIDKGLSQSKFGIVVISRNFFAKKWPQRELRGLVAKEIEEGKIILPIWHNITKKEIISHSPPLADVLAVNSDSGIKQVVLKIMDAIGNLRVGDSALVRAKQLLMTNHHEMAIISAATHLESYLKERALSKYGYGYFKKRPLRYYSLGAIFSLLRQKRALRIKYNGTQIDFEKLIRYRNYVLHNNKRLEGNSGSWYVDEVEKLIEINHG